MDAVLAAGNLDDDVQPHRRQLGALLAGLARGLGCTAEASENLPGSVQSPLEGFLELLSRGLRGENRHPSRRNEGCRAVKTRQCLQLQGLR